MLGIAARIQEIRARATTLARLQLELVTLELKRKGKALAIAAALAIVALVVVLYGIGFIFAAIAAGIAEALPLWAALLAVMGEALGARVGFLNHLLYTGRLSAGFNAVTSGNNETDPAVAFFKAEAGWDPCTGWGTPDAGKLITLLRGKPAG